MSPFAVRAKNRKEQDAWAFVGPVHRGVIRRCRYLRYQRRQSVETVKGARTVCVKSLPVLGATAMNSVNDVNSPGNLVFRKTEVDSRGGVPVSLTATLTGTAAGSSGQGTVTGATATIMEVDRSKNCHSLSYLSARMMEAAPIHVRRGRSLPPPIGKHRYGLAFLPLDTGSPTLVAQARSV